MTTTIEAPPVVTPPEEERRRLRLPGGADRTFRVVLRAAGGSVLAVMATVGVFLGTRAWSALRDAGTGFVVRQNWQPDAGDFGVAAVMVGTVLIALVAICFAVPLATGMALYISEYATGRWKSTLIGLVDLMAAVPSVVYGLWGFTFLQPNITGLSRWLATYASWIPFLRVDGYDAGDPLTPMTVFTSSTFIAGLVVALMVTPIISSVMREVFSQAPLGSGRARTPWAAPAGG